MNSVKPAKTPELRAHQAWIGFVQPVGLVVSLPALMGAQCMLDTNVAKQQSALEALATPEDDPRVVDDFRALVREVLDWNDDDLQPAPAECAVALPEYGETLKPEFVVPGSDAGRPLALVSTVPNGSSLDDPRTDTEWAASPEVRLERMLREIGVPIGILFNGENVRLVYAPNGESSGHVTFSIRAMCQAAGRDILAAFCMLLSAERLFGLPEPQRLAAILRESRKYQNEVSTRLSESVLAALYELLRGFEAADRASNGDLLREVRQKDLNHVYGGLLATLLRLVFILYAEDRGLLSNDPIYVRNYSVNGLFERLRADRARYPDTMDQRYGGWGALVALFRLIHDGGGHGAMKFPPRYGRLFDPDAYPFLEGRPYQSVRLVGTRAPIPKVSDGVVYGILDKLLILDSERISYRALDVEQIGSVYEAMMGFAVDVVTEPSIGLRAKRKPGAPPVDPVVGLQTLLALKGSERAKWLDSEHGVEVSGKPANGLKEARTLEELCAALEKKRSPFTPEAVTVGSMVLQPTEERRRSGSHYTPRALTEPIVMTTLRPILDELGENPTADEILSLKICDPAMGSGAFLVAACRALGDRLLAAWQRHGMPVIPPDEDPLLHARRMVAQRCLYGVDKNPFAVDLGKLSLWLATLAREHPFTFLDHALRQGDSLIGLTREQIASLHWDPGRAKQVSLVRTLIDEAIQEAEALRLEIQSLSASDDTRKKRRLLDDADHAVAKVRRVGNLVIEAFFAEDTKRGREDKLKELRTHIEQHGLDSLPNAPEAEARTPFHWEIEFPEVFSERRFARAAE